MSIFQQWLRQREFREGLGDMDSPSDNFKLDNSDKDYAVDNDHVQHELFKTIMEKYPEQTMSFFDDIARQGDEEIASLLNKLQRNKGGKFKEPRHPNEEDEVMPPMADTGYNNEFAGDD